MLIDRWIKNMVW